MIFGKTCLLLVSVFFGDLILVFFTYFTKAQVFMSSGIEQIGLFRNVVLDVWSLSICVCKKTQVYPIQLLSY